MSETVQRTERQRTLIFINLMITCIAVSMLATAVTTALPAIVTDPADFCHYGTMAD